MTNYLILTVEQNLYTITSPKISNIPFTSKYNQRLILRYFPTVVFCQGHLKLHSKGQENPFKLCLRDKSPEADKTYADECRCYLEQSAGRQWSLMLALCHSRELAGYGRWKADCSVNGEPGRSHQQRDPIASPTSMSLLSVLPSPLVPCDKRSHSLWDLGSLPLVSLFRSSSSCVLSFDAKRKRTHQNERCN